MANDLQMITENPTADLTRLTTPLVNSALVGETWQAEWGRRVFDREGIDTAPLIAAHDAAVRPVSVDWLADRLNILWKSSVPSNGLDAKAWLHETTRLLCDLPKDLVSWAIDEAVRKSPRGFLPSVGEIRAHAEPQLKRRRLHLGRLKAIAALEPEPPLAPEERCTPQEAERIRREAGIKFEDEPKTRAFSEPPRAPTRAEYIAWGVDPADLPPEHEPQPIGNPA